MGVAANSLAMRVVIKPSYGISWPAITRDLMLEAGRTDHASNTYFGWLANCLRSTTKGGNLSVGWY